MGARGMLPTKIGLAPGMAGFAFLHEVGHALEDTLVADIQKQGGDLDAAIDRLYSEVEALPGPDLMQRLQRQKLLLKPMLTSIATKIQEERLQRFSHQIL